MPDYEIFHTLRDVGIRADASVKPASMGRAANSQVNYPPPVTTSIKNISGIYVFPFSQTYLIHDWNVTSHQFGWSSLDSRRAALNREDFKDALLNITIVLRGHGGEFLTYQTFQHPPSLNGDNS